MDEKMDSLYKNSTRRVNLRKKKEGHQMQIDFAKKDVLLSLGVRYNASLVAKDYAQQRGVDYNGVFSLIVKHSSICILLVFVMQLDMELVQMDVKIAFLHDDKK